VLSHIELPKRLLVDAPFLMSVDHCFTIKGQGSVATGTLLRGSLQLNQLVELVGHFSTHKVKSMEVFKQRVKIVRQGERVGVLLPTLDASLLERGLLAHPGSISFTNGLIVTLHKIRYYKADLESGMKLHISIGHSTCLAKITLFISPPNNPEASSSASSLANLEPSFLPSASYDFLKNLGSDHSTCFALLHLEKEIPVPVNSIYIASKLDADIHTNSCRLAFHGKVLFSFLDPSPSLSTATTSAQPSSSSSHKANPALAIPSLPQILLSDLHIFTTKIKIGAIDRIVDDYVLIGRNLFKKETKMALFIGLSVQIASHKGVIDSSFGSSGKFKVRFSDPVAKSISLTSEIELTLKKRKFDTKKSEKKR
jgi:selenocysteine-specific elongation factor